MRLKVHNISLHRYDLGDGSILVPGIPYIVNTSDSTHSNLII